MGHLPCGDGRRLLPHVHPPAEETDRTRVVRGEHDRGVLFLRVCPVASGSQGGASVTGPKKRGGNDTPEKGEPNPPDGGSASTYEYLNPNAMPLLEHWQ